MKVNTERLYLRPVVGADAMLITTWKSQPLMRKMSTGLETVIKVDQQQKDIESNQDPYMMICLPDKTPIGYIRVNWMDEKKTVAWLRFGLGTERKQGYMTEALKGFIEYLFQEGMHRMDAEVFDYNENSLKLLKNMGFQSEGIRRKAHYEMEAYHDVHVLGLLKEDYKA